MTASANVDISIRRVRAWLASSPASNTEHAASAGVDEKVVRQARQEGWNPRAATLRRLEALIPEGWRPEGDDAAAAGAASASAEEGARPAEPAARMSLPGMISAAEEGER